MISSHIKQNGEIPTSISQSVLVELIDLAMVLGAIIFLTVIIGIMAFFYRKRFISCKRQLLSDESHYYSNNESGLFNDKYGGIIVNTTNTVETSSRASIMTTTSNTIKYIKSIYNEKISQSELPLINPDYNNNMDSFANNLTKRLSPPPLTLLSNNYKQPKDVLRGYPTSISSNINGNWFTKPIDSPIISQSPSPSSSLSSSMISLPSCNWSKAPWQDDLIQLSSSSLIKQNETNNLHNNINIVDKLDKPEVPNKDSLNRFSLFTDFKRANVNETPKEEDSL